MIKISYFWYNLIIYLFFLKKNKLKLILLFELFVIDFTKKSFLYLPFIKAIL